MIEKQHYLAALIAGIVLGMLINYGFYAIAIPVHGEYLLAQYTYQALSDLWGMLDSVPLYEKELVSLVVIGCLPFLLSIISMINPQLRLAFSLGKLPAFANVAGERKRRAWLSMLVAMMVLVYMIFVIGADGGRGEGETWITILLGGALTWTILSASAWGNFSDSSKTDIKSWLNTALHGAAFMSVFNGLVIFFVYLFSEYIFRVIVEVVDPSFEVSLFAIKLNAIYLLLATIMVMVLSIGLLPFFTTIDKSIKQRIAVTKTGIGFMVVTGLVIFIMLPLMVDRYDLDDAPLAETNWLKGIKPEKYRLLRLCAAASCDNTLPIMETQRGSSVYTQLISDSVNVYRYGGDNSVPVNRGAIEPLRKVAMNKASLSVKRKLAIEGLMSLHETLLQPAEYIKEIQSLEKAGAVPVETTISWILTQMRWLANAAPITVENQKLLEYFSDEDQFFHGRFANIYLAYAWARFGDEKQSLHYKERTITEDFIKYDPDKDGKLIMPAVYNGRISGKVVSTSLPVNTLRVLLITTNYEKGKALINKPEKMHNVVANARLQDDGVFSFENLVDGHYGLALMADTKTIADPSQLGINNKIGLISVNRDNPTIILSDISINADS